MPLHRLTKGDAGTIHLTRRRKTKVQGSKEITLEYTGWKPGATMENPAHSRIKSKNRKSDEGQMEMLPARNVRALVVDSHRPGCGAYSGLRADRRDPSV